MLAFLFFSLFFTSFSTPSVHSTIKHKNEYLAKTFLKYFDDQISALRKLMEEMPESHSCASYATDNVTTQVRQMHSFKPVSMEEMGKIIGICYSKYCALDPIPSSLLKAWLAALLQVNFKIRNLSFSSTHVPDSFK